MAKKPSGFRVGNVSYGRFSGVNPKNAGNENRTIRDRVNELKSLSAETDRMLKTDKSYRLNSGAAAYGPKPPSTAARIAGAVGRGALRAAGPAGALVGMTTKTGDGREAKPSGPLMRGNTKPSGTSTAFGGREKPRGGYMGPPRSKNATGGGFMGPPSNKTSGPGNSGGKMGSKSSQAGGATKSASFSAPMRVSPSPRSGPSTSLSAPSRTAPSKAAPSKVTPSKSSAPSRPSSGPTSAPSRSALSKANLGTSRFAKGGAIKRRKK